LECSWNVRPVRPVRSEVSATPRTGPDARTGWSQYSFRGFRDIVRGQSQVSDGQPFWTSGTDSGRVRNVTKFLIFWEGGGTKHFPKEENRGISAYSRSHVFFWHAFIQSMLFLFKINLQDFLDFYSVSVTSGTILQKGVCERVVSKDRTLMYNPVWRFTCIQLPVIFF